MCWAAETLVPIRAGVIGYQDVRRACQENNPDLVGWERLDTFYQACQNLKKRGEIDETNSDSDSFDVVFLPSRSQRRPRTTGSPPSR